MTRPIMTSFNQMGNLIVQKYERYLPTAFDESMSLLQKVNKVIEYLNDVGELANDVVEQWNNVMIWIMGEGINESVNKRLDEMTVDGTLDKIINENIFADLNVKLVSRARIDVSIDEPSLPDSKTLWYKNVGSPPNFNPGNNGSGNIIVSDDEPNDTTKTWYDIL